MRTALYGLSLLTLAGCGLNETHFVPDYADRYCDAVLACSSPAQLTFDGVSTHDDCLALIGDQVDTWGGGCKYKGGKAKKCLEAMETLACPAEGKLLDDVLPPECDEVYIKCEKTAGGDDDDDDDETTEPEETGIPS